MTRTSTGRAPLASTSWSTHTWYDESGRVVGTWAPNGPGHKVTYDGLGRVKTAYTTDRRNDGIGAGSFANVYDGAPAYAADVADDVVLEQTSYQYRPVNGMLDLVTTRARTHDAGDTRVDDLANWAGVPANQDRVITTYGGLEYDGAARPVSAIDFGTNQTLFQWGGPLPAQVSQSPPQWNGSSSVPKVSITYGERGLVETVTEPTTTHNPAGKVTKVFYDALGRQYAVVENFQNDTGFLITWNGTRWTVTDPVPGAPDKDRVTSRVFKVAQNESWLVAHEIAAGGAETVEITKYLYGVTTADSLLNTNDLLREIIYPDSAGTDDSVRFTYNRLGEILTYKDQNQTAHSYTRDLMGRLLQDEVTAIGGGIDNTIDKISVTYDSFGRPTSVESRDVSSTIKNDVELTYTTLWQLQHIDQDPRGEADYPATSTTRRVTYGYSNSPASGGGGNHSRVESMTYPDGFLLDFVYGNSGSSDDRISRPVTLGAGAGLDFATYSWLGLGRPVVTEFPDPNVRLDHSVNATGVSSPGYYPGLDRFGRLVRLMWIDGVFAPNTSDPLFPNRPPLVDLIYTFDKAGNVTARSDGRTGSLFPLNQQYLYDGLDRLKEAKRGSGSGFTPPAKNSQQWTLDAFGNWKNLNTDLNGDGLYQPGNDRLIAGSFNLVNEVTNLVKTELGSQPLGLPFQYDAAGNLKQKDISATDNYTYDHDAWNRLVKSDYHRTSPPTAPRAEYEYNGLHWRTVKRCDSNVADTTYTLNEERFFFYSADWQILEEHVDDNWTSGTSTLERNVQTVWGVRHVDDPIVRRQDTNRNGDYGDTVDFTNYLLTDIQFSVVAVINFGNTLVERVSYDAYGEARHHFSADIDGDGDVDSLDRGAISGLQSKQIHQAGYRAECDIDRSGTIDAIDMAIAATFKTALIKGQISQSSVGNAFGYCSYVFNAETSLYTVRFRNYDPATGRWLEREPAGYVDGVSLYEYVAGHATIAADPSGQALHLLVTIGGGAIIGGIIGLVTTGTVEGALAGAVGGAVAGATFNLALGAAAAAGISGAAAGGIAGIASGAAGGAATSIADDELNNRPVDWRKARQSGLGGAAFGGGLGLIGGRLGILGGACFLEGTLVLTPTGLLPIEEIRVGDRVVSTAPAQDWATAVDPETWRVVSLALLTETGEPLDIEWLRPASWIDEHDCQAGSVIAAGIPELGLYAPAHVLAIEPCPPISDGLGNVVLATFSSQSSEVIEISFVDSETTLALTPIHRLYSVDRAAWISAGYLCPRETIQTRNGVTQISAIETCAQRRSVHNLEVETLHQYFVSELGVVTHNSGLLAKGSSKRPVVPGLRRPPGPPDGSGKVVTVPGGGGGKAAYMGPDGTIYTGTHHGPLQQWLYEQGLWKSVEGPGESGWHYGIFTEECTFKGSPLDH